MRGRPTPDQGGMRTLVTADREDLAEQASSLLLSEIKDALAARGRARIILAGGSTPRHAYELLASGITAREMPVHALSWFFGDERWVEPGHPRSNEGMARECLLRRIAAPEHAIYSWNAGTGDPVESARLYGDAVQTLMGPSSDPADLLILGLGADGHTASLFPGAFARLPGGVRIPVGPEMPGVAAAVEGDGARDWRLTLCPIFLRTSRCVVFLVTGGDKAAALSRARKGEPSTPGAWIRGGRTIFIVTRDAMGPERADYGREIRHA